MNTQTDNAASDFQRLWDVADDREAAILSALSVRAGIYVECKECGATYEPDQDACEFCGTAIS